jgi:hypothetical protein
MFWLVQTSVADPDPVSRRSGLDTDPVTDLDPVPDPRLLKLTHF